MRDTIEMAREAAAMHGHTFKDVPEQATIDFITAFAALVREDEREACAKFCETHQVWVGQGKRGFSEWGEEEFVTGGIHQGMDYAAAIRARKQE